MTSTANNERSLLQSVRNGFRILKCFSKDQTELGVTQMARIAGLHKSSVNRSVKSLVQEGFLQLNPVSGKYRLGLSLLSLSGVVTSHLEIHRIAQSTLRKLVQQFGEAVHISILEGPNIAYLDKIESTYPVKLLSDIGKINPAYCTSSGQVLLAYQPEENVNRIYAAELPPMGPSSITDREVFKKRLQDIRAQGYAVCVDELHEGAVSIGAPVKDYSGQVIAAVSLVGPKVRINSEKISAIISAIVAAGQQISEKLGYLGEL